MGTEQERPLRIIELTAENVKAVKAVTIRPDGDVILVGGSNGAGKTSTLDAIELALRGGAASASKQEIIRHGQDHASATVDLGDIIVTRTWKGDTSKLVVTSREGAVFRSPQAMLDALVGAVSFDPLRFANARETEQRAHLIEMFVDWAALAMIDTEYDAAFAQRTERGRDLRTMEARLGEFTTIDVDQVSIADLASATTAFEAVVEHNRRLSGQVAAYESAYRLAEQTRLDLARAKERHDLAMAQLNMLTEPTDAPIDPTSFRAAMHEAEAAGKLRDEIARREQIRDHVRELETEIDEITRFLDDQKARKVTLLAAAPMPVPGLAVDPDGGVTFQGVPFSQCSSAERLRVSVAVAIAANPRLRVIRISDGSLLDDRNLAVLRDMAAEHDMQLWIERVGAEGVTVVIEDGEIA